MSRYTVTPQEDTHKVKLALCEGVHNYRELWVADETRPLMFRTHLSNFKRWRNKINREQGISFGENNRFSGSPKKPMQCGLFLSSTPVIHTYSSVALKQFLSYL